MKKYLHRMVNQKYRPYRTVGCCYTMVLFHRYHPGTKELSSPKWAFEVIRENTVEESADHFIEEMNDWIPKLHLYWGDDFLDGMEEITEHVMECSQCQERLHKAMNVDSICDEEGLAEGLKLLKYEEEI